MATHIKDIIEFFFKKTKNNHSLSQKIEVVLDTVLDKETRKHISLKHITSDGVVFNARSSSAIYNFNLKKEKILNEIKKNISRIEYVQIEVC